MPDDLGPGLREKAALPCKAKKGAGGDEGLGREGKADAEHASLDMHVLRSNEIVGYFSQVTGISDLILS